MKWFWDLFKPAEPQWHQDCLAFTRGLASQKEPAIQHRAMFGYLHEVTLDFGDVTIELEYNQIRREWSMEIWSREARDFLFYHDCIDPQPVKAIEFLLDAYPGILRALHLTTAESTTCRR